MRKLKDKLSRDFSLLKKKFKNIILAIKLNLFVEFINYKIVTKFKLINFFYESFINYKSPFLFPFIYFLFSFLFFSILIFIYNKNYNLSFSDSIKSVFDSFISQTFPTLFSFSSVGKFSRKNYFPFSQDLIEKKILNYKFLSLFADNLLYTSNYLNFLLNPLSSKIKFFSSSFVVNIYFYFLFKVVIIDWLENTETRDEFKSQDIYNPKINFIIQNSNLTFYEIFNSMFFFFLLLSMFKNVDTFFSPFFNSSPYWFPIVIPLSLISWILVNLINVFVFLSIYYWWRFFLSFRYYSPDFFVYDRKKNWMKSLIINFLLFFGIIRIIITIFWFLFLDRICFYYFYKFAFRSLLFMGFNLDYSKKIIALIKFLFIIFSILVVFWKNKKNKSKINLK